MKRFLLLSLTLISSLSFAQVDGAKARQLLMRGMGKKPLVNIRAIISQRQDYNSSVMQQIKVEMSKDGKMHQLVLAPISRQGLETVDDLEFVRSYSPDDRLLIVQPSIKREGNDVQFRMSLVDKNYKLSVDRREKIAGRNAVIVEAVPKNRELDTRCYAIDEKTGFVLRLETCRPGRQPMLHFETKIVSYPDEMPADAFKIDSRWTMTKTYEEREILTRGDSLPDLSFQPVIPKRLPMGFAIQEMEADIESKLPSLAIRMTDGLAKATVYQWPTKGVKRLPAPAGTLVRDSGNIRLLISGDVPDEVKQRLIDSFLEKLGERSKIDSRGIMAWALELQNGLIALPMDMEGDLQVLIEIRPVSA